MMPAKRRSNLVVFQRMVEPDDPTHNADGRYDDETVTSGDSWTEHCRAWVSIDPIRGREVFRQDEREAVVLYNVRGDYLSLKTVDETMRMIRHESAEYDPIPDDAEVYLIRAGLPNIDVNDDVMLKCELEGRRYGALTQ